MSEVTPDNRFRRPVLALGAWPAVEAPALCRNAGIAVRKIPRAYYAGHMDDVRCAWDRGKAAANLRQRRVAFEEAQTAFLDDHAPMIGDPEHSADEARFVLRGLTASLRMLVVVHPPDRRRCDRKRRPQSADVSACDAREQGLNLAAE